MSLKKLDEFRKKIPPPQWSLWGGMFSLPLRHAILLTMNICPNWHEMRNQDEIFESNMAYYPMYSLRLKQANSAAFQVDWIIQPLARDDLKEEDYVDLKKFIKWAVSQSNWADIPEEFKQIDKEIILQQSSAIQEKNNSTWQLKNPKRLGGYRLAVLKVMKDYLSNGKNPPQPYELLDIWRKNKPPEILEVMSTSIKYETSKGISEADIKAIKKVINNLIASQ